MNICFPSLSYPVNGYAASGVGSQVRLLAHSLLEAGNSISVVDLAEKEESATTDDHGAHILRMRSGRLHWFVGKLPLIGALLTLPLREIEYSIAVWRGVRAANKIRKLDLIEGTETGMLLVALFSKSAPLLIRLHGEQYTFHKYTPGLRLSFGVRVNRALQRVALRRAKLLVSPSYAHAHEIQNELGAPHPPIVVVPNVLGIAGCENHSQVIRNAKTVLYVGRIERRKGVATLLQAAAQMKDSLPESRFVFAGDFHSSFLEPEFRSLVHAHGLDAQVELLGRVGWNDLSDWYRRSAVSVLPSHYETFGVAALEPMVFGTPVIATSGGALSEVVEAEVTGKLVAAGDSDALAGALTELLTDAGSRERMGQAALARAATYDVRHVMPLNSRAYEWCTEDLEKANAHVFFSPHLDDAVLSCGGMIHSLAAQKKSVRVVTVFAGEPETKLSAFARHLHAKWKSASSLFEQRRSEDARALAALGIKDFEHWDFAEAPYRRGDGARSLYASYGELRGDLAKEDQTLQELLTDKIAQTVETLPQPAILYFPLSLGRHVDHQMLFAIGLKLNAAGKRVCFYEDYPYAGAYERGTQKMNWLGKTVPVAIEPKLKAARAYTSQIGGLGGTVAKLEKRLREFSAARAGHPSAESYWQILAPATSALNGNQDQSDCPLALKPTALRLRDFKDFLKTFRWHDLEEILPVGEGVCLDMGCGARRYQSLIENRGYKWCGLDRSDAAAPRFRSDAAAIPLSSESVSAAVAWQVFEYLERPEAAIAEAARVLETGGVFCGSVSFLEPLHGRTYFNMSPLILEKLLMQHGFGDVEIKPGLNGFALMLWTWLRRSAIPFADRLAIPIAFALLAAPACLLFFASWLATRLGFGKGHLMEWLCKKSPLEFAGHVMFTARKAARPEACISPS